jgi:AcrR family transcriptional regulator
MSVKWTNGRTLRTRAKILKAAGTVFSQKGYDAARVEEIVRMAGVNKALLFYHFKSKENIFHELIRESMKEMVGVLKDRIGGISDRTPERIGRFMEGMMEFLLSQKSLLKMLMIEAIKDGDQHHFFMDFMDPVLTTLRENRSKDGSHVNEAEYKMKLFYVSIAPIVTYIVLGDKWSEFYGVSRKKTDILFTRFMKETQSAILTD